MEASLYHRMAAVSRSRTACLSLMVNQISWGIKGVGRVDDNSVAVEYDRFAHRFRVSYRQSGGGRGKNDASIYARCETRGGRLAKLTKNWSKKYLRRSLCRKQEIWNLAFWRMELAWNCLVTAQKEGDLQVSTLKEYFQNTGVIYYEVNGNQSYSACRVKAPPLIVHIAIPYVSKGEYRDRVGAGGVGRMPRGSKDRVIQIFFPVRSWFLGYRHIPSGILKAGCFPLLKHEFNTTFLWVETSLNDCIRKKLRRCRSELIPPHFCKIN